jgi:hypothetical protein
MNRVRVVEGSVELQICNGHLLLLGSNIATMETTGVC